MVKHSLLNELGLKKAVYGCEAWDFCWGRHTLLFVRWVS